MNPQMFIIIENRITLRTIIRDNFNDSGSFHCPTYDGNRDIITCILNDSEGNHNISFSSPVLDPSTP